MCELVFNFNNRTDPCSPTKNVFSKLKKLNNCNSRLTSLKNQKNHKIKRVKQIKTTKLTRKTYFLQFIFFFNSAFNKPLIFFQVIRFLHPLFGRTLIQNLTFVLASVILCQRTLFCVLCCMFNI